MEEQKKKFERKVVVHGLIGATVTAVFGIMAWKNGVQPGDFSTYCTLMGALAGSFTVGNGAEHLAKRG